MQQAWAVAQQRLPALRAAQANSEAALARVDQASTPLWPTSSIDVTQAATTANFALRPGAIPKSAASAASIQSSPELYPFFQGAWSGRWMVYDFGRTNAAIAAAKGSAQASRASERVIRRQLWLQMAAAYLQVLAAEANAQVAADAHALVGKRRDLVKVRVDAEARPMLDLLRAESDLQAAVVALLRAKDHVRNSRLALGLAVGLTAPVEEALALPVPPTDGLSEAQLMDPAVLDRWVVTAAKQRDEVAGIDAQVAAARAELQAMAAMALPSVFVQGQVSLAGTDMTKLVYNASATAGASLPLSGLWLQAPQTSEIRANLRRLQAQREGVLLELRGELDVARTLLVQARRRRPSVQTLLALADKAQAQAQVRYHAGAAALVDVIDTEAARNQARLQLLDLDLEEALAVARWQVAMGAVVWGTGAD